MGTGCPGEDPPVVPPPPPPPPDETPADLVPLPRAFLDRTYEENKGLLIGIEADGTPTRFGAAADAMIDEARRFYDTLKAPGDPLFLVDYSNPFTGTSSQSMNMRATAPATFEEWKTTYGFSPRMPNETMEAWRVRTDTVIYYNKNELGLGREIGCSEFDDGQDAQGNDLTGIACFVTNYGVAFNDQYNSLHAAVQGINPKNTVCITHRPSAGEAYSVQFYVYGPTGARQEWAQLDGFGPRPHPHICMSCHGGSYDMERHLAKNARFLPLDPNVLVFAEGNGQPAYLSRASQEEAMRKINALSLKSPLTESQAEYFSSLYDGKIETVGQKSLNSFIPEGWRGSTKDQEFFSKILQPHCGTCHLADQINNESGQEQKFYAAYKSAALFRAEDMMMTEVCGMLAMPNAQPTQRMFWTHLPTNSPITIDGKSYVSPAHAFVSWFDKKLSDCNEDLEQFSNCRSFPDPDALCGNAVSGTACDRATGRCVPALGKDAPMSTTAATGYCRTDETRNCVSGQECRVETTNIETYDGACYTCGRLDFPVCTEAGRPACEGTFVEMNGLCKES